MTKMIPILVTILLSAAIGRAEDLGTLSANPFDFESSSNAFGKGNPFAPNGINNLFSPYGSPFSNKSATNPFAIDAPSLYDSRVGRPTSGMAKQLIAIRLSPSLLDQLRKMAAKQGKPYQTLIHELLERATSHAA